LTQGQDPNAYRELLLLPWNDVDALRDAFETSGAEIAAVITEPVMCNTGAILPRDGYLQELRQLCDDHGALLIFDEVITGFRVALGGAVELFGVTPDLATYGKAIAGGWPVAAIAGRADLMSQVGTGEVVHAGTFNGSTMACAAVAATIRQLRDDPPYARIERHGRSLMEGLETVARDRGVSLHVQGLPCAFHASLGRRAAPFTDPREVRVTDQSGYAELAGRFAEHGVWVAARGIWYVSAAHGEPELEAALARVEAAFSSAEVST
jgi:glutamate-1-semialdehyde 2,1-aminomutase